MRKRNGRGGGAGNEGCLQRRRPKLATLKVGSLGAEAAARVQLWADVAPEPGAETGRRWAGSDGEEI